MAQGDSGEEPQEETTGRIKQILALLYPTDNLLRLSLENVEYLLKKEQA